MIIKRDLFFFFFFLDVYTESDREKLARWLKFNGDKPFVDTRLDWNG